MAELLIGTLTLLLLGITGWFLFTLFKLPLAPLLGPVVLIGALRLTHLDLPKSPFFLVPAIMIFLGYYIGSQINREKIGELKQLLIPVAIIIGWTLSLAFIFGFLLSLISGLDPYTAILSSCIGGIAEVTLIAVDTGANVAIVTFIQSFRMITTVLIFPLIYRRWMDKSGHDKNRGLAKLSIENDDDNNPDHTLNSEIEKPDNMDLLAVARYLIFKIKNLPAKKERENHIEKGAPVMRSILSVGVALAGAYLFGSLKIPAGPMVGSMFFIAFISLSGLKVITIPPSYFGFLLVGVGITVSDYITPENVAASVNLYILLIAVILTAFIMVSSMLVAYLIHVIVKWDYPTCFLAASPAGLSVMTPLAIKYDKDSFQVSMLHLCRLLAVNAMVPIVFAFLN